MKVNRPYKANASNQKICTYVSIPKYLDSSVSIKFLELGTLSIKLETIIGTGA